MGPRLYRKSIVKKNQKGSDIIEETERTKKKIRGNVKTSYYPRISYRKSVKKQTNVHKISKIFNLKHKTLLRCKWTTTYFIISSWDTWEIRQRGLPL